MKLRFLNTTGALLAFFIGIMSVFSGSLVLFGSTTKDYNVLQWLIVYNVIVGVISIVAAFLMWKNVQISKKLILIIFGSHFFIFLYLKLISETVAVESIQAMLFRVGVWIVIAILSVLIPEYFPEKQL
jgi:hypothetical protein